MLARAAFVRQVPRRLLRSPPQQIPFRSLANTNAGNSSDDPLAGDRFFQEGLIHLENTRFSSAITSFAASAKLGSADGNFFLGLAYDGLLNNEDALDPDPTAAYRCYTRAADLGHTGAMMNMSMSLREGSGVPLNIQLAFEYMVKSADGGDARAAYNAAIACDPLHPPWGTPGTSDTVKKDAPRAVGFYKMAAEDGDHAKAKVNLGVALYTGTGVQIDKERAEALWSEVVERQEEGVTQAEFCLRNMDKNPNEFKNHFHE